MKREKKFKKGEERKKERKTSTQKEKHLLPRKADNYVTCILQDYANGELLTGYLKRDLIAIIQKIVSDHQQLRRQITDEVVHEFMAPRPLHFQY